MRRLLITCIITIMIGLGIFTVYNLIFKQQEIKDIEQETVEENYEFDISYAKKIAIEELENIIKKEETILIFTGKEAEEATRKVSTILKKIKNIESFDIYYLEKEDNIENTSAYKDLLTNYSDISNFINFTPVILAFKNNQFLGGLPGEVEQKNIINFLKYIDYQEE